MLDITLHTLALGSNFCMYVLAARVTVGSVETGCCCSASPEPAGRCSYEMSGERILDAPRSITIHASALVRHVAGSAQRVKLPHLTLTPHPVCPQVSAPRARVAHKRWQHRPHFFFCSSPPALSVSVLTQRALLTFNISRALQVREGARRAPSRSSFALFRLGS